MLNRWTIRFFDLTRPIERWMDTRKKKNEAPILRKTKLVPLSASSLLTWLHALQTIPKEYTVFHHQDLILCLCCFPEKHCHLTYGSPRFALFCWCWECLSGWLCFFWWWVYFSGASEEAYTPVERRPQCQYSIQFATVRRLQHRPLQLHKSAKTLFVCIQRTYMLHQRSQIF